MRVFVTGGAGFIGSAACRRLVAAGASVFNLDKLTYASNLASLQSIESDPRYSFVKGDVCDGLAVRDLIAEFDPDAVLHLAAESHVDRSIEDAAEFIQTNVAGTHAMLDAALMHWAQLAPERKGKFRFVHVSTDEVFGALGPEGAFDEATAYDPRSPYSASKAASDHLARVWGSTYGMPVIVSNCSNNYGPHQFPEKLIPLTIINALEGRPIDVYGDGRQARDWLHVDDHVAALTAILERGRAGETYVVGGRSERCNLDVVHAICDMLDEMAPAETRRRTLVRFVEDRPGHDRRYAVNCAKIERELGWAPSRAFEQGLRETVAWYLAHEDWWRPLREQRFAGVRQGLRAGAH